MRKIEPPEELEGEALLEWHRVIEELQELGGLKAVDRATLTLWCKTWAVNYQVSQHVSKFGPILPAINKALGRSPWYQVMQETTSQLSKLAEIIGLTRKSRDYDRKKDDAEQPDISF